MPYVPLILTHKGVRYELSVKRRVNCDGETIEYPAADSLQSYVTGLYRAAGFGQGYSSHRGHRTFATRLLAQGHPVETVQLLLGHSHLDHVAPYLEVSKKARRHAMADLGGVFEDD
ncbi:tyrosine-type recombinase/integrase [Burkholderia stagnalis]|uniref:tyrosine-type recombinase/integrase n=1 Tax=Burkholderia stagnalis TaxID=1503054 RepID=UPI000ADE1328|nr:tyrosine-type recombinase/integrase [Burkholderia stagnalis]